MQEKEDAAAAEVAAAEAEKKKHFVGILNGLQERNYSLADFMEYVFNPATQFASGFDWRWRGFFAHKRTIAKIFGYWSSKATPSTRIFIFDWAYGLVQRMVSSELRRITRSGILNKAKKTINEAFFMDYSLTGLSRTLRAMSPRAFGIFDAFSTTSRQLKAQEKAPSTNFTKKRDVLAGSAALSLLNGASQNNSYAQAVNGTYLMATGGQRQHFSILHGFGWSMSYTSIISKPSKPAPTDKAAANELDEIDEGEPTTPGKHARRNKENREAKKAKKKRKRTPGTLSLLSDACRTTARILAATGLFLVVYDNINMMVRIAEQILGRKNTQENGTCATVVPLHDAKPEDLLAMDLDESIANAAPLSIEDLEFTEAEGHSFVKT
ncbi:hypothetical protein MSAN_00611300 [Mycena sanguinolenta]|uniref:Uncharacterized protein n=1 Tax=Mycena sanguinolenta TaxID=230812 RepID=A0A8H6ZB43_9AGAR|nr:hypothetical protein MSAN_00611300 [Mycena sanguinolenta]